MNLVAKSAMAALSACALSIAGCVSAPHLQHDSLDHLGKTEVVYVTPQDDMVITDPGVTRLEHAGKFVALDYLFGGIGVVAYFAGNKSPGGMEGRIGDARTVFTDQHRGRAHARRCPGGGRGFPAAGRHLDRAGP